MKNLYDEDINYIRLEEKISLCEFLDDIEKPALIVEGKTDIDVYSRVFKLSNTDINKLDLVVGECKSNILKYYREGLPFKYVALIDSDFDKIKGEIINDKKLIYTEFYDMENYLTTLDVIKETYKDLDDIFSSKITICDLYNGMIECLYAFIVAVEYKLEKIIYNNGEDNVDKLFPIEDRSIFDENWWDNKEKKVDLDKMKNWINKFCAQNNIKFDVELWNKLCEQIKEKLKFDNAKEVQLLIKGRRLIEAYKIVFEKYLGNIMKKRDKDIYKSDLRKNLDKSKYIKALVNELDLKLKEII